MSTRQQVKLTEAEQAEFLASQMKVQIATIHHDGAPHLTTLFYVLDDDGRIAFWTYGTSQKIANLKRDPRIAALVEDGEEYFELRGVSIRGTARLITDYEEVKAIGAKVVRRMADGAADLGPEGDAIVEAQARKRIAVIVEPDRVISWDHRKLTSLPGQQQGGAK